MYKVRVIRERGGNPALAPTTKATKTEVPLLVTNPVPPTEHTSFGSRFALPALAQTATKAETLNLNGLPPVISAYVNEGKISLTSAYALLDCINEYNRNGQRPLLNEFMNSADRDVLFSARLLQQQYSMLGRASFVPASTVLADLVAYKPVKKAEGSPDFRDANVRFATNVGKRRE
jgi:hypothetical protein